MPRRGPKILGVAPKFEWEESPEFQQGFPKIPGGSQIPWAGQGQRANPPRVDLGREGTLQNSQETTGMRLWLSGEGELEGNGEKLGKKERELGKNGEELEKNTGK